MKTIKLIILAILFVSAGSVVNSLSAQENLNKWVKKCESISSVETSLISYKNPETKKLERETVRITFADNDELRKDLFAAFEKDKANAYMESTRKVDGEVKPDYCRFYDNKGQLETRYSIVFKKEGKVNKIIVTKQVFHGPLEPLA
ncbi:DUF5024 domain-containing protein [Dysgonomonas sp. 25]|uniref:DUF5024 domain-containing protein n=1 Tax=Dysgonomonas sp. 25 TaxID=2302933 RepID=UPI0013D6354C|nr:DUF5024 domain-containing protein [Dysgonomonas sp. 25]